MATSSRKPNTVRRDINAAGQSMSHRRHFMRGRVDHMQRFVIRLVLAVLVVGLPAFVAAQSGTVMPSPFQVVLDSNGDPVSGALIYTYMAGTTTAASTYTTSVLDVANANPIVADSAGRYVAFLPVGASFKFVIKDAGGVTLRTVDGISAVPASSGNTDVLGLSADTISAGNVVYLSDGTDGYTAGTWRRASATYSARSGTVIVGMAPAAIATGVTGTIRLAGRVTGLSGLTAGTSYYVSTASGALTASLLANRRLVGVADGTTSLVMAVQPKTDWLAPGAVVFYNLAACPSGWTEYTAARGLYIVGLPSGGTLAGSPAAQTALSNKENRAVGQHDHTATSTVTDPGHLHTSFVTAGSTKATTGSDRDTPAAGNTGSATTRITVGTTVANAGSVAGTNAPYIQLLACVKQ